MVERVGDFLRNPEGNPVASDLAELTYRCLERFSDRISSSRKGLLIPSDCPY